MTAGGSTSARSAAMKILLEDIEPLLKRVEDAATLLKEVRGELNADLTMLGVLAQRTTDAQPILMDAMKRLNGTASRIEAATVTPAAAAGGRPAAAGPNVGAIIAACLGSAVLAALLVGCGFYLLGKDTIEQARIGRALQSAWPALDAGTREKVQGVLGK